MSESDSSGSGTQLGSPLYADCESDFVVRSGLSASGYARGVSVGAGAGAGAGSGLGNDSDGDGNNANNANNANNGSGSVAGTNARGGCTRAERLVRLFDQSQALVQVVSMEHHLASGVVLVELVLGGSQPHTQHARRGPVKRLRSAYRGVSFHSCTQRWRGRIKHGIKSEHLGYFLSDLEAAKAYNDAARSIHGDQAQLNGSVDAVGDGPPSVMASVGVVATALLSNQLSPYPGVPLSRFTDGLPAEQMRVQPPSTFTSTHAQVHQQLQPRHAQPLLHKRPRSDLSAGATKHRAKVKKEPLPLPNPMAPRRSKRARRATGPAPSLALLLSPASASDADMDADATDAYDLGGAFGDDADADADVFGEESGLFPGYLGSNLLFAQSQSQSQSQSQTHMLLQPPQQPWAHTTPPALATPAALPAPSAHGPPASMPPPPPPPAPPAGGEWEDLFVNLWLAMPPTAAH